MNQNPTNDDIESMTLLITMRQHTQAAQLEAQNKVEQIDLERRNLAAQVRADATNINFDFELLNNRSCKILSLDFQFERAQANAQLHIVADKIEPLYLPRLVVAPLLEVDDVVNATFLVNLRYLKGWLGSACLDVDVLDEVLFDEIVNVLEYAGVPILRFRRNQQGQPVFL